MDWIVLRALEKDRNRRYDSAASFADDIERYLAGNPVAAAAPSPSYIFRKFAKRHRVALATVASFATILLMASGISSVLAVQAHKLARDANEARNDLALAIVDKDDALQLAKANEALATKIRQSVEAERDRLVVLNYANTIMRARQELDTRHPIEAQKLLDQVADYPDRGFEWYHLQHRLHPESAEISTEEANRHEQKVAYSPDGNRVAFCESPKRRVRLFDVSSQTPEEQKSLICDGIPGRVAFSHQGDRIAVSMISEGRDGFEVVVYDSQSLQRLHSLPHRQFDWGVPMGGGYGIDFSPKSNVLATVDCADNDEDLRVRIWDVDTARVSQEITVRDIQTVLPRVQFGPNGKRIAVCDAWRRRSSVVIELATEEIVASFEAGGRFFADGEHFVTSYDDSFASSEIISSIIDLSEPKQVRDFVKWKGVRMYDFELSPDGKWVAGGTKDGTHLWRADTLELVTTLPVTAPDIAFSPSGTSLATFGDSFKIWNLPNRPFVEKIVSEQLGYGGKLDVAWAPDNFRLIYSGRPGPVEIWNTHTGETEVFRDAKGQQHRSTSVDWSSDGTMIAIAIEDAEYNPQGLGIFDVRTKQRIKSLVDPMGTCNDVRFSPDSKWLAARFDGGVVRLWSTSTWNDRTIVEAVPSSLWVWGGYWGSHFSFSPDSRELAVCRIQPRVDFFDVGTGELLRSHSLEPSDKRVSEIAKHVRDVDYSPDGSLVLVCVGRNRVDVLNCQTGAVEFQIDDVREAVSFAPDGRLMFLGPGAGGSNANLPGRIRLFETTHGTELVRLDDLWQGFFSPDGRQLFGTFRADREARGGIIHRAMSPAEYERREAIRNSSPPSDGPPVKPNAANGPP